MAAPPVVVLALVGALLAVLVLPSHKSSADRCRASGAGCTHAAGISTGPTGEAGLEATSGGPGASARNRKGGGVSGAGSATPAAGGPLATGASGAATGGTAPGGSGAPGHSTPSTGAQHAPGSTTPGSAGSAHAVIVGVSGGAGSTPSGTLASAHSETGSWSTESSLGPELEPYLTTATIAFTAPLRHSLYEEQVTYVKEAEANKPGALRSPQIRAACGDAGTTSSPTARPGHLCVYAAVEDLRDRNRSGGIPTHPGTSSPFVDAEYLAILNRWRTPGANKTGAEVAFGVPSTRTSQEEAAGAYPRIAAHGSWAVTAP